MVDHDASILNDADPCVAKSSCRLAVMNSELHPNGARSRIQAENFIDMGSDVLRSTE